MDKDTDFALFCLPLTNGLPRVTGCDPLTVQLIDRERFLYEERKIKVSHHLLGQSCRAPFLVEPVAVRMVAQERLDRSKRARDAELRFACTSDEFSFIEETNGDVPHQIDGEGLLPLVVRLFGPPFDESRPTRQLSQMQGKIVDPQILRNGQCL